MKAFMKHKIPTYLYVIFCPGEFDFVGGYSYSEFIKEHILKQGEYTACINKLGKLSIADKLTGEQIHSMLFEKGTVSVPAYWKQVIAFY